MRHTLESFSYVPKRLDLGMPVTTFIACYNRLPYAIYWPDDTHVKLHPGIDPTKNLDIELSTAYPKKKNIEDACVLDPDGYLFDTDHNKSIHLIMERYGFDKRRFFLNSQNNRVYIPFFTKGNEEDSVIINLGRKKIFDKSEEEWYSALIDENLYDLDRLAANQNPHVRFLDADSTELNSIFEKAGLPPAVNLPLNLLGKSWFVSEKDHVTFIISATVGCPMIWIGGDRCTTEIRAPLNNNFYTLKPVFLGEDQAGRIILYDMKKRGGEETGLWYTIMKWFCTVAFDMKEVNYELSIIKLFISPPGGDYFTYREKVERSDNTLSIVSVDGIIDSYRNHDMYVKCEASATFTDLKTNLKAMIQDFENRKQNVRIVYDDMYQKLLFGDEKEFFGSLPPEMIIQYFPSLTSAVRTYLADSKSEALKKTALDYLQELDCKLAPFRAEDIPISYFFFPLEGEPVLLHDIETRISLNNKEEKAALQNLKHVNFIRTKFDHFARTTLETQGCMSPQASIREMFEHLLTECGNKSDIFELWEFVLEIQERGRDMLEVFKRFGLNFEEDYLKAMSDRARGREIMARWKAGDNKYRGNNIVSIEMKIHGHISAKVEKGAGGLFDFSGTKFDFVRLAQNRYIETTKQNTDEMNALLSTYNNSYNTENKRAEKLLFDFSNSSEFLFHICKLLTSIEGESCTLKNVLGKELDVMKQITGNTYIHELIRRFVNKNQNYVITGQQNWKDELVNMARPSNKSGTKKKKRGDHKTDPTTISAFTEPVETGDIVRLINVLCAKPLEQILEWFQNYHRFKPNTKIAFLVLMISGHHLFHSIDVFADPTSFKNFVTACRLTRISDIVCTLDSLTDRYVKEFCTAGYDPSRSYLMYLTDEWKAGDGRSDSSNDDEMYLLNYLFNPALNVDGNGKVVADNCEVLKQYLTKACEGRSERYRFFIKEEGFDTLVREVEFPEAEKCKGPLSEGPIFRHGPIKNTIGLEELAVFLDGMMQSRSSICYKDGDNSLMTAFLVDENNQVISHSLVFTKENSVRCDRAPYKGEFTHLIESGLNIELFGKTVEKIRKFLEGKIYNKDQEEEEEGESERDIPELTTAELAEIRKELEVKTNEFLAVIERLEESNSQLEKLKGKEQGYITRLKECEETIAEMTKRADTLVNENTQFTESLEAKLEEMKEERAMIEKDKEKLSNDVSELENAITQQGVRLTELVQEAYTINEQKKASETSLNETIASLKTELGVRESEIYQCKQKCKEQAQELETRTDKLKKCEALIQEKSDTISLPNNDEKDLFTKDNLKWIILHGSQHPPDKYYNCYLTKNIITILEDINLIPTLTDYKTVPDPPPPSSPESMMKEEEEEEVMLDNPPEQQTQSNLRDDLLIHLERYVQSSLRRKNLL